MSVDPRVRRLIIREAKRQGVDPAAALAVAMVEGGVRFGAVGDGGTSFGPFQLHEGGALPRGRGADWANSPAGIAYAVRKMREAGAGGLSGRDAVAAIVHKFERPAAPGAEVDRAMQYYGKLGARGGASSPSIAAPSGSTPLQADPAASRAFQRRQAAALSLVSQSAQTLTGGIGPLPDPGALMALALERRQALTAAAESRAQEFGGTTMAPANLPKGGGKTMNRILQAAHAQIGKPYVWGGESPKEGGFDCSGLIDWAFRQAGIDLPGRLTTSSALGLGKSVKGGKYQAGDLIVTNGGKHMVMYVGGGRVIAAPHRGEPVQYQPLARFNGDIVDVRRVIGA